MKKRKLGLKVGTWKTVIYLTLFMYFLILVGIKEQYDHPKIISPIPPNSPDIVFADYKVPSLASLPERQRNIALIKQIWGKDAWIGLQIARCESGFRSHAVNVNTNGSTDSGLYQINSVHQMPDMENATANILYAYQLYKTQGLRVWDASKECWSK